MTTTTIKHPQKGGAYIRDPKTGEAHLQSSSKGKSLLDDLRRPSKPSTVSSTAAKDKE